MNANDLPMHALRSFVAIVDYGNFTKAAEMIGLTQPTVSQQLKRLEEQLRYSLIVRGSGPIRLTDEGQTLLDYARRILTLNDEAVAHLSRTPLSGTLRIGIPHEFTHSILPKLVGAFSQIEPDVVIEVECELSKKLIEHREKYDLVMMLHKRGDQSIGTRVRTEPLAWVSSLDYRWNPRAPLKIVAAPKPCLYRDALQFALSQYQPGWSLLLTSTSYGAVCAAVGTGMGITVLAKSVVPSDLQILTSTKIPKLPALELRIDYDAGTASEATMTFARFLRRQMRNHDRLHDRREPS